MSEDDLLPAASSLLGDEARDIVGAAVEYGGGRLRSLTPKQVQYRPGRSLAVVYDARIQWSKRARVVLEGVVAMTTTEGAPEGALPIEADGMTVGVWRVRNDPMLPGLEHALSPDGARSLLGDPSGPVSIALRAYRPTRRAVVALTGSDQRFAKVVRPPKADGVANLHERFAGAVPAPEVLGVDRDRGIVTLRGLPGRSLLDCLVAGDELPSGGDVLDLVDRIGAVPPDPSARPVSARADAAAHARFVTSTMPEVTEQVAALLDAIGDDPVTAPVTIHGDLYETQLLVTGGRITGVLDLDRSGPGHVGDDLATLLAHLGALAIHRPAVATAANEYGRALWTEFSAAVDGDDLRRRVVAVLIGLATTPFRLRRPEWRSETARYLDLARAWSQGAHLAGTPNPTITGGHA